MLAYLACWLSFGPVLTSAITNTRGSPNPGSHIEWLFPRVTVRTCSVTSRRACRLFSFLSSMLLVLSKLAPNAAMTLPSSVVCYMSQSAAVYVNCCFVAIVVPCGYIYVHKSKYHISHPSLTYISYHYIKHVRTVLNSLLQVLVSYFNQGGYVFT